MKTYRIEFRGLATSLAKWRELLIRVLGVPCTELVHTSVPHPHSNPSSARFIATMTEQERNAAGNTLWYLESGTGTNAVGAPFKWNDCVGYRVISETTN